VTLILAVVGCEGPTYNKELPILGNHDYQEEDTIYHTVGPFALLNQDSVVITGDSLRGYIYVADFFFTSCPTICPTMKTQMMRIYEKFENDQDIKLVSHSIDPEYDTVGLLHEYAMNLGVSSDKWWFLTGAKDSIYQLAESSYMVMADEDADAPGGYIHSGAFLLVDPKGRIRGVYDGTLSDQVDVLMKDSKLLKEENE